MGRLPGLLSGMSLPQARQVTTLKCTVMEVFVQRIPPESLEHVDLCEPSPLPTCCSLPMHISALAPSSFQKLEGSFLGRILPSPYTSVLLPVSPVEETCPRAALEASSCAC